MGGNCSDSITRGGGCSGLQCYDGRCAYCMRAFTKIRALSSARCIEQFDGSKTFLGGQGRGSSFGGKLWISRCS